MPGKEPPHFSNHRACRTLTGITVEHLPRDGALGRACRFSKGEDIWCPNDRADRIYFLQRGEVAVMTRAPRGREVTIKVIGVGEPFGELCFCAEENGVHHTTARALVASTALQIKQADFVEFLQQHRDALTAFVFTFCERLSDAERRIEVLGHRDAEGRLGNLLLQLCAARGEKSGEIELRIGHEELARMAAMSRSHVTVTLGRFRERRLVRYQRNRPLVVDMTTLKAYLTQARAEES